MAQACLFQIGRHATFMGTADVQPVAVSCLVLAQIGGLMISGASVVVTSMPIMSSTSLVLSARC